MGLIGTALGAVGSIFGGIKASQAMKKAKANIDAQRKSNQDWYDRRSNEDATQRADAQAALTRAAEDVRNRNRQAAGAQAVMGGTQESVAASKAANNEEMSRTASSIAAAGARRKDALEAEYRSTDMALAQQQANMEMGRAQAVAQATKALTGAVGEMDFGTVNWGGSTTDEDGNEIPRHSLSL